MFSNKKNSVIIMHRSLGFLAQKYPVSWQLGRHSQAHKCLFPFWQVPKFSDWLMIPPDKHLIFSTSLWPEMQPTTKTTFVLLLWHLNCSINYSLKYHVKWAAKLHLRASKFLNIPGEHAKMLCVLTLLVLNFLLNNLSVHTLTQQDPWWWFLASKL